MSLRGAVRRAVRATVDGHHTATSGGDGVVRRARRLAEKVRRHEGPNGTRVAAGLRVERLLGDLDVLVIRLARRVLALVGDATDGEDHDRGENAEDHDHDEELDEGEPTLTRVALPHCFLDHFRSSFRSWLLVRLPERPCLPASVSACTRGSPWPLPPFPTGRGAPGTARSRIGSRLPHVPRP